MARSFVAGQDGVHRYRIPAMVLSPSGALLVVCEARNNSVRDASPTDMVLDLTFPPAMKPTNEKAAMTETELNADPDPQGSQNSFTEIPG